MKKDLKQLLEESYRQQHGTSPPKIIGQRLVAKSPFGNYVIFQTAKRKKYNRQSRTKSEPKQADCPLCRQNLGQEFGEAMSVGPDPTPFASYHFLLRFLEKNRPAHREVLIAEDLQLCLKLAAATNYLIGFSMRGSGASVPYHVHAHAFKRQVRGGLKLPLLKKTIVESVNVGPDLSLSRTTISAYGTLLQGDPSIISQRVIEAFNKLQIPFNFIAGVGQPYGGNWMLVFWRSKQVPTDDIFFDDQTGWWRFGFSEMLGLFEFKSERQKTELTREKLDQALSEVTISDKLIQDQIEKLLAGIDFS